MVEGEQRGTVWPEDVPEDVLTGGGDAPAPVPPPVVTGPAPTPVGEEKSAPRARRASHLKLVE
jgi:hypothetical protein